MPEKHGKRAWVGTEDSKDRIDIVGEAAVETQKPRKQIWAKGATGRSRGRRQRLGSGGSCAVGASLGSGLNPRTVHLGWEISPLQDLICRSLVYLKLKLNIYFGEAYTNITESVCISVCLRLCYGLNPVSPPNSYIDPTIRTSEWDCIWQQDL